MKEESKSGRVESDYLAIKINEVMKQGVRKVKRDEDAQ